MHRPLGCGKETFLRGGEEEGRAQCGLEKGLVHTAIYRQHDTGEVRGRG